MTKDVIRQADTARTVVIVRRGAGNRYLHLAHVRKQSVVSWLGSLSTVNTSGSETRRRQQQQRRLRQETYKYQQWLEIPHPKTHYGCM